MLNFNFLFFFKTINFSSLNQKRIRFFMTKASMFENNNLKQAQVKKKPSRFTTYKRPPLNKSIFLGKPEKLVNKLNKLSTQEKKINVVFESRSIKKTTNKENKLISNVTYAFFNTLNQNIDFKFFLGNLIFWGTAFNYKVTTKFFLKDKIEQKYLENVHLQYNSEMLLRYAKRNAQVIIHMPRVPSLVFKKFLLHRELVRQWNNNNSSDMLFGFGTGDCGFKPNETKTFIAKDTLVRAGLWIITRFVKRLSPIKLRFQGNTNTFRQYLNRLTPKTKKFKYVVAHIEDSTAISFNGCKLSHAPRKRFRYHTNNFRNLVNYVKVFQDLKPQGMRQYKKYF